MRNMTYKAFPFFIFIVCLFGFAGMVKAEAPTLDGEALPTPADDSAGVATDFSMVITFSEAIFGQAFAGITIFDTDNNILMESITANDGAKIEGDGTAVITVTPTADYAEETDYHVLIAAGSFKI